MTAGTRPVEAMAEVIATPAVLAGLDAGDLLALQMAAELRAAGAVLSDSTPKSPVQGVRTRVARDAEGIVHVHVAVAAPEGAGELALMAAAQAAAQVCIGLRAFDPGAAIGKVLLAATPTVSLSVLSQEPEAAPAPGSASPPARRRIGPAGAPAPAARRVRTLMSPTETVAPPAGPAERRDGFRQLLAARGLKITELARAAAVTPGVLYAFLQGRTPALPPEAATAVARALGVPPERLYGGA